MIQGHKNFVNRLHTDHTSKLDSIHHPPIFSRVEKKPKDQCAETLAGMIKMIKL